MVPELDSRKTDPPLSFFRFWLVFVGFSLITIFLLSKSMEVFESPTRISIWDAKFALVNIFVEILFVSISLAVHRPQLNMAFFWIFQLIFFGIAGFLSILDPFPYYLTKASEPKYLTSAVGIVLIAQTSVCMGQLSYFWYFRNKLAKRISTDSEETVVIYTRAMKMLKLYILTSPFIIYSLGGFEFLFKRVRFGSLEQNLTISLNATLQTLLYVPPLVVLLVLLYLNRDQANSKYPLYFLSVWIVFLSNPLGNARQTTLFLIFPILFYYLQKRIKLAIFFFLTLPFVFLYSAGVVNRYTGSIQVPQFATVSRDGDFDAFSQVANGLQAIHQGGFPIFRQIFASIFFFIPRSLYSGKPADTGVELAKILGLKFQNLSAPWILEAYANARIIGVISVGISLGFVLTSIDFRSLLELRSFLIGSMTSGFLFIILRGSLLQATGRAVFSIFLIHLLLRKLGPKSFDIYRTSETN